MYARVCIAVVCFWSATLQVHLRSFVKTSELPKIDEETTHFPGRGGYGGDSSSDASHPVRTIPTLKSLHSRDYDFVILIFYLLLTDDPDI